MNSGANCIAAAQDDRIHLPQNLPFIVTVWAAVEIVMSTVPLMLAGSIAWNFQSPVTV